MKGQARNPRVWTGLLLLAGSLAAGGMATARAAAEDGFADTVSVASASLSSPGYLEDPWPAGRRLGAPLLADGAACCDDSPCWFAGAEYRWMRAHFSEAVAFATLTTTPTIDGLDLSVVATELDFDYTSSFAVFTGVHLTQCSDIRFTYWYFDDDIAVSAAADADQVIVDPFGNLAPPGTTIDTTASVRLNVFDLEYVVKSHCCQPTWAWSFGVRFADVNQDYDSVVLAGEAPLSAGVFSVDYFGLGPYASFTGRAYAGPRFSAFGKIGAALLVGQYDIATAVAVVDPDTQALITGGQSAERIRAVPVLETELGLAFEPTDRLRLSAGWLVQAWWNLGVSGGTFDGENLALLGLPPIDTVFGGADDADIMSFDGLFARVEWNF